MFVSTDRVPVTLDNVNIIYIRPKMDFATRQKAQDAMLHVGRNDAGDGADITAYAGAYVIALAKLNFLAWEGPDFTDPTTGRLIPCTPQNIERLDPDSPLLEAALHEVALRNPMYKRQGPTGTTTDLPLRPPEGGIEEKDGVATLVPLAERSSAGGGLPTEASSQTMSTPGNGTSISTSPAASNGHLQTSEHLIPTS